MANIEINAAKVVVSWSTTQQYIELIRVVVFIKKGKFTARTSPIEIIVEKGSTKVKSFSALMAGGEKEIIAFFTTDAFGSLSGTVNITVQHVDGTSIKKFSSVNISTFVGTLDPVYTGLPSSLGTNLWFTSL